MKKNLLFICALLAATGVSLVTTSCKDADDVQDITLGQVLSPTSLKMTANADISITVSWNEMFNADSYELVVSQDESFTDATKEVYNQTIAQAYVKGSSCSVKLPKLDPETTYYGRLKAISSKGVAGSKYVFANVITVSEQIMNPIQKADITDKSVAISWTAGEVVKEIQVLNADGDVVKTIVPTDTEIQNGKKTIDGLTAHTTYTIRLVSTTDKTRGRRTFTTLLDLSNATVITAAQGADGSWQAIIEGAAAGTTFALEPGDYTSNGTLKITNNVVIAAKDITKMPILHTQISIDNNASLYCYYIALTADDNKVFEDQCFVFKSNGATGSLDVEGCEIYNYKKGLVYVANNVNTIINEINITESYIHDIVCNGGDFLDTRAGYWTTLNFKNNTVVNSFANRAFVRVDVGAAITNVENNTFYKCGSDENGDSYGIFTNKDAGAVSNFNNNIVEGYVQKRGFNGGRATATVKAANNVYFNCLNLVELDPNNTSSNKPTFLDDKGQVLTASPFVDAKNGDFRLTDPNLRLKQVGAAYWYGQDVPEE